MRNYLDTKCAYGYMTLCDDCVPKAPPQVNVKEPVIGLPIVQCEICKCKPNKLRKMTLRLTDAQYAELIDSAEAWNTTVNSYILYVLDFIDRPSPRREGRRPRKTV